MNNQSIEKVSMKRLIEIAKLKDKTLSDGKVISPDAYQTVASIEITRMARELLAFREAARDPVSLPDHMPFLNEKTLNNIINNDQEGSVGNAARMLACEVKFWHSKALYAAPAQEKADG